MSELFTQPVSAGLLRVLAQAAEGYPNQGEMYFVASYKPDVNGSFEVSPWWSPEEAAAVVDRCPGGQSNFGVFGPFDTTLPYSTIADQEKVTSLQVTTVTSEGLPGTPFTIGGAKMYDAVFFSLGAVIKFAMPYYTRVYSPAFAETMLQAYLNAPVGMMVHLPWSEYGEMEAGGEMQVGDKMKVGGEMEAGGELDISGKALWGGFPAIFERNVELGCIQKAILPPPTPPPHHVAGPSAT